MTNTLLALSTFLADALPPESVVRKAAPPTGGGDLGATVASLAGGAAVIAAATLLVWRRSARGADAAGGEGSAVRQAALGGVSLKLALAWALIACLFIASAFTLSPTPRMDVIAFVILLVLCPLLGGTGAAIGGLALAGGGPTPRLRRWRALAGVVVNVVPVFFCLYVLLEAYRESRCILC